MLLQPCRPSFPVSSPTIPKQRLEHGPWIPFSRQRLSGTAPRQRMGIDAAEISSARSRIVRRVQREFERGDLSFISEVPCEQLVHRHVRDDFDLVPTTTCGASQKRPRRTRVDIVPTRIQP